MDIEALIKKHFDRWVTDTEFGNVEAHMRAALTELAAEHDHKQALLLEAHCERVSSLQERIRQLEAELAESRERIRQMEAELAESRERIRQMEAELAESREQAERMLDAIYKLHPLASRVLWLAFVWNDHNFTHPLDYAREEAKKAGLNSLEDAQEFLADVAMLTAAPAKEQK